MSPTRNDAIPALTGFRWLAATLVFLYHNRKYWRDQLPDFFDHVLNEFHLGVSLFFILSGYLITHSYGAQPTRSGKAYTKYILQRAARVYPMYWLILAAYTLDPLFGNGQLNPLLFTLAHGFSDQLNLQGISQAWSLTVEFSFYLIAPFLVATYTARKSNVLLLILLIFGLFAAVGMGWKAINGNPRSFFSPLLFLINGTLAGQIVLFLAGAFVGVNTTAKWTHWLLTLRHKTRVGSLGVLLTLILSSRFQKNLYDQANLQLLGSLFQIGCIGFFGMIWIRGLIEEDTRQSRFFGSRLLVLLGNASFIFYLIHISYVNIRLQKWTLLPDRNYLLLWMISCLLYLWIERPVYRLAKKAIRSI